MAAPSLQIADNANQNGETFAMHKEPEKPEVYEPPDLIGRKHVEKIAGEYRFREDECLADRLQNEEFEMHFGKNKVDRKLFHMDLQTAKDIYLKEIEDSGMLSKQELSDLCKDDLFLAAEVEKRINENKDLEAQSKAASELQDEEFAKYLQMKEKQKLDFERKERLRRHIEHDKEAARRLQRELNAEAGQEEVLCKGISQTHISSKKQQKSDWAIDCELGSTHGKDTKEGLKALKTMQATDEARLKELENEQRRIEEERDFRIAVKLQREEAKEYQKVKREQQFRRTHSEKVNDDGLLGERRKHLQYMDESGKPSRGAPPCDMGRTASLDIPDRVSHANSTSRNTNPNKKVLQSVDATGRPIQHKSAPYDSYHNVNIPRSYQTDPDVINRPFQTKNMAHDSTHHSAKIPASYQTDLDMPPKENIYLQAVDLVGNGGVVKRDHVKPQSNKSDAKKTSLTRQESWGCEISKSNSRVLTTEQQSQRHAGNSRNVAAAIDPTYATVNHSSNAHNKEESFRPTPVVQNTKRSTLQESERRKKKWFSKKEK